jgi:mycobactin lysine-N-oxygenase
MAIVAKACALKTMGRKVPDIKVIEPHVIGAHWGGHHGYTDGRHELGTGPEKDVGFPYNSAVWPGGQVDDLMMKMFSFPAFRLEKWNAGGPGAYSERIDRGGRIRTYHQEWAEYLQWVWGKAIFQAKASVELIPGTVSALTEIEDPKRWRIAYQSAKGPKHVDADGVVLTGPGPARHLPKQPIHPLISDAVDLWLNLDQFENLNADDEPIGIIGSGESAASAVQALARVLKEPVPIMVINRQGAIFSRGEGFFENQLYTEPEDWSSLPLVERRDIIRRTDRGVFSLQAMTELNQLQNLQHRRLIVKSLEIRQPENQPVLFGEYEIPLQRAIVAVGFDPWWFVGLVQDKTLKALLSNEAIRDQLLVGIGRDLTFPTDLVPFAKLHVPMLAGLAQGPGFPNLSCLGHVADRVLAEYVT